MDYLFHFTLTSLPHTGNWEPTSLSCSSTVFLARPIQVPHTHSFKSHIRTPISVSTSHSSATSLHFTTFICGSPNIEDSPATSPHKHSWSPMLLFVAPGEHDPICTLLSTQVSPDLELILAKISAYSPSWVWPRQSDQ